MVHARLKRRSSAVAIRRFQPQRSVACNPADRAWLQGYMRQIFEVENAVLQLQSFAALVARAPFLVERFRTVADDKVDYLKRQYDQDLSSEKLSKLRETAKSQPNAVAADQGPDERWLRAKLTSL